MALLSTPYSVQIFTWFPRGALDRSTMGRLTPPVCSLYNIQVEFNNCKRILQFVSSITLSFSDSKYFTVLQETKGERETLVNSSIALLKALRLHHALIQSAGFCEQLNCFPPFFFFFSFFSYFSYFLFFRIRK